MKKIGLGLLFLLMPVVASAAIPYRAEQILTPVYEIPGGNDSEALAREQRFYLGGFYNYSIFNDDNDGTVAVKAENTSNFEGVAGVRVYDTFRIELNYLRSNAQWDAFNIKSDIGMINAIVDARIDSMYRYFRTQMIVPYVGVGGGLAWNSAENANLGKKISPVAAALAGMSVEFNSHFALDFGYRYMYMFSPDVDMISDFSPIAHQFRAGARISF